MVVATKTENANDFDEFFTANYAQLTRIIYRIVGDTGWAEELAAESFWKLQSR